jgi:pyruvate formate lyase activating enzyme
MALGKGSLSPSDLYDFLRLRQGKLDGVVLSGGECTLYPYLLEMCEIIKTMGFEIKVDTNGLRPQVLQSLIEKDLIDFVALDFKARKEKFETVTSTKGFDLFAQSLEYLIGADIGFEVRTTVHADLLNEDDINAMSEFLHQMGYNQTYYLQKYLHVSPTLGNMPEPKRNFDVAKLHHLIPIQLRNFN